MQNRMLKYELTQKYFVIGIVLIFTLIGFRSLNREYQVANYGHENVIFFFAQSENVEHQKIAKDLENGNHSSFLINRIEENKASNSIHKSVHTQNEILFDTYLVEHELPTYSLDQRLSTMQIMDVNGVTSIYKMILLFVPFLVVILSLFCILHSIHNGKKAYNYIMTLPLRKSSLIKVKWQSSIMMSFLGIILFLLASFIIGTSLGGVGDFSYPIVLQTSYLDSTIVQSYIPLWSYILLVLFLSFLQILFFVSLGLCLCKVIKNTWAQYLIAILLMVVLFVIRGGLPVVDEIHELSAMLISSSYHLICQGYRMVSLLLYLILLLSIPGVMFLLYLRKNAKCVYYDELT